MKKKLSLLLALLMLTSIAALAACSKVEPITVKVVINVAEEDDRGRREVTETILETDFAYESSTPTLNDLLVKLRDAGKINLVTEADGDNVIITGINDLVPKTDETENYDGGLRLVRLHQRRRRGGQQPFLDQGHRRQRYGDDHLYALFHRQRIIERRHRIFL